MITLAGDDCDKLGTILITRGQTNIGFQWMQKAVLGDIQEHRKTRIYIQLTEYYIRIGNYAKASELGIQAVEDGLDNYILLAIHEHLMENGNTNATMPSMGGQGDIDQGGLAARVPTSEENEKKNMTDFEKYEALCRGDNIETIEEQSKPVSKNASIDQIRI